MPVHPFIVVKGRSLKSVSLVQNQGVGRTLFPPETTGEKSVPHLSHLWELLASLASGHITPIPNSVITLRFSASVCANSFSSSFL